MSSRILVRPSGHAFEAEPSETLLQAGLRAGLNLDHSCANGSCGECKARLIEGRIEPACHHDFRLTEAEKQAGVFLLCSNRADGDVEIEAHEAGTAAEIAEQHVRAKVSKVEQLQDDVVQLTVRAPRSGGMSFLAGQGVLLRFDGMKPQLLSIASCPCDAIQLRFHLRRHAGDAFSDFVFNRLRKGREVILQGPVGGFTLDEDSTRPMVMVAWESGFAPISSLVDHAIQKDENRSIDLYWLSSIPRGHYLSNYCRAWRDALDDFRYHSIDLEPAGDDRMEHVVQRLVRQHAQGASHDFYLAMPGASLRNIHAALTEAGVPGAQIHCQAQEKP
ncbi:2Fe-2S iron-sulfur cluster-binding protein [Thiosocius teredinicola]|uniref:2Fe-2S iron-sulfur cluster-binding protein n=1 Tax=Thiosocius teredinicola TaxID=1973002 RepID=UPI0009912711